MSHHRDDVRRTLTSATTADVRTVAVERTYPTDAADLWHAVTDADRLARWIGPVSGDLRAGGRYRLEGDAGGTVEVCDPPTSYALTWEWQDQVSHVRVHVGAVDGGARLRIEHDAPVDDHWREFGPAATGIGWEGALRGLAQHVLTGQAVDADAEAAWTASPAGIRHVRACGQAWAAATVAAGDDPRWAHDAAARTVAFYTGAT